MTDTPREPAKAKLDAMVELTKFPDAVLILVVTDEPEHIGVHASLNERRLATLSDPDRAQVFIAAARALSDYARTESDYQHERQHERE